jgi:hypothetical protein
MKHAAILMVPMLCLSLALTACDGSDAPKPATKKSDRSESDFSAAGMVKEIEEMKKAGEKGKASEQPQPAQTPAQDEPKQ